MFLTAKNNKNKNKNKKSGVWDQREHEMKNKTNENCSVSVVFRVAPLYFPKYPALQSCNFCYNTLHDARTFNGKQQIMQLQLAEPARTIIGVDKGND